MQLDEGPLIVFERPRFLQDGIGNADLAQIVQRSRVEQQMCALRVPAHVLRQNGGVMAETYVVIRSLIVFVADRLGQTLGGIQVSLCQLPGILLLALERLLEFSGLEQQLTVSGGELFGALTLCVEQLAKVLRVRI